jgi:hypothetical protein
MNEAADELMNCGESGVVDNVVPKSEEPVAIVLLDPWARSTQEIRNQKVPATERIRNVY